MKKILLLLLLALNLTAFGQYQQGGIKIVGGVAVMQLDTNARTIIKIIEDERIAGGGSGFTTNEKWYVNYLVTNLKKIGVWTKIKALYGFVGGTASSHKWNWKDMRDLDVAYRATFPNGVTHSSNGITANAVSSQFVRTFLYNNEVSINSNHLSIYSFNITSGSTLGGYLTNNNTRVSLNTTSFSSNNQTTTALGKSLLGNSRFTILNRSSNTISSVFNNGINIGSQNITALTNTSVQEYRFFNRNIPTGSGDIYNNDPALYVSGTINFSSIGDGLTDTEAIQMSNIVTFAQGILSRQ